jgi:hypothetical protein
MFMLQIVTNMNETLNILHLQRMAGIYRNLDGQTTPKLSLLRRHLVVHVLYKVREMPAQTRHD